MKAQGALFRSSTDCTICSTGQQSICGTCACADLVDSVDRLRQWYEASSEGERLRALADDASNDHDAMQSSGSEPAAKRQKLSTSNPEGHPERDRQLDNDKIETLLHWVNGAARALEADADFAQKYVVCLCVRARVSVFVSVSVGCAMSCGGVRVVCIQTAIDTGLRSCVNMYPISTN